MAKTTSQIVAENKAIAEARDKIHQQQMAGNNAAQKTQAILQKALSSPNSTAEAKSSLKKAAERAGKEAEKQASYTQIEGRSDTEKKKLNVQKEKEDRLESKNPVNPSQFKKDRPEKQLEDLENQDFDWTDASARAKHEADRKELERVIAASKAEIADHAASSDREVIASMSDDERKTLSRYAELQHPGNNPILALFYSADSRGLVEKYGEERLRELAETYERDQNAEFNQKVAETGASAAEEHPFLSSVASVPVSAVGGIYGTLGQLRSAVSGTGRYPTLDPNAQGTALQAYSGAVRSATADRISGDVYDEYGNLTEDGGFARQLLSYVYQGGMSALDSGARLVLGGGALGGATLAAANTFSQTLSEASAKGATPEQAMLLATASAAVEAATEKIPLDNLVSAAQGKNAVSVIKNTLRQAGIEITEEEASLVGTLLAEAAILGEKSDFNQTVTSLKQNGLSEEEAKQQAWGNILDEAVETMIVSGLSGAGSGFLASLKGQYADPGEDLSKGVTKTPEPLTETQPWDSLYQTSPEAQAEVDAQRSRVDEILDGVIPKNQEPVQAEAPSRADEIVNKTLEDIGLKKSEAPAQEVETPRYRDDMTEDEFIDAMVDSALARDPRNGVENPLSDRTYADVGKRNVNAYQYENPEVKPYFQEQALWMLNELQDTQKGERGVNAQAYYESGGEKGHYGTKRMTSDSIAELRDQYGMTYNQIEQGIYDIIQDAGSENNAVAKRIEFVLNDRLMNGYTDFYTGEKVQPNTDYLNMLKSQQSGSPTAETTTQPQQNATQPSAEPTVQNPQPSAPQVDTPRASTEGGQDVSGMEAVGAAEQNFTGKPAYYSTLSEDNAQADRASDVRPMELPKTDVEGNPVSAVTGNVYASEITPDEFASLMEEPTARGDFSYVKIPNDQATQRAMDSIGYAGDWESAYSQWSKEVGSGKAGAEMTARGALLLNHAAQEGNKTQWLNILADMQDLGTNTAQGLQAFRILRDLSATDKVAFMEIAAKRLGQQMGVEFAVDQSLYDAYNKATTPEAKNIAIENIQQAVADQVPSTMLDKWNALRYTNMLGNLKTNVRNIAGNVATGGMYRVKDQIAATMEDVLSTATGGKYERTKSHTVSREMLNSCANDFDMVSGIVGDGGKYGTHTGTYDQFTQGVMDKRRIFKSDNKILNAVYAPMEGYRKLTNWAMNNKYFGDEAFGKAAYARSLAGYLKAHGVTDTDLSKVDTGLMDKARSYAVREAQEATFHDNSALANVLGKLKRDTGVIGEGIMPFTKTPANALTRAAEFSPLGFLDTAAKTAQKELSKTGLVNKGEKLGDFARGGADITGADLVNSLSKSLTGAGIFTFGAWLKSQGFLTGGPDSDDDKDSYDSLNGDQNYALRFTVGGHTYNFTFDWLSPTAMPLFMGSQFMDIMGKGFENMTFADLEQVFTNIADPMLQMSMLQGLNDSLDNIKYADNNLGQFFINAAVSYLTQGFGNTLLGQIERSTEKNRMTTYVDKDSQMPTWLQKQLGSLSQKIPGWDFQQTEYINARGETEENEGGLFYNLFSPGYISEEKSDKLSDELYRLNDSVADANVFPDASDKTVSYTDKNGTLHKDVNLTADQYKTYAATEGQTATQLSQSIVNSSSYAALTDEQKAKAIQEAYSYAKQKAEIATFPDHTGYSETWMKEMPKGKEAEYIIHRVTNSSLSSAWSSVSEAWSNDYDVTARSEELNTAYESYSKLDAKQKRAVLKDASGSVRDYVEARDSGVSHDKYLFIEKTIKELKTDNPEKAKNARAVQKAEAIVKQGGITEKQKEVLVRQQVSDSQNENIDELKALAAENEALKKIYNIKMYAELYRDKEDYTKGTGKKNRTISHWVDKYDLDWATAKKLYEIFS